MSDYTLVTSLLSWSLKALKSILQINTRICRKLNVSKLSILSMFNYKTNRH